MSNFKQFILLTPNFRSYSINTYINKIKKASLNKNTHLFQRFFSSNSDDNSRKSPDFYLEQTKHLSDFASYFKNNNTPKNKPFEKPSLDSLFTHFDNETNKPKQVDISEKREISNKVRVACASGYIQLNKEAFSALVENKLKKGNALIVAQIAGINASKQTSNLIPLCHQILLDVCDIEFHTDKETYRIYCKATCKSSISKTGVEMESLTACSISLLTIYDMCKAIQKDAQISEIKLDYKYGGKTDFKRT